MPEADPEAGRRRDINASTELENGKSPAEILTEATGGEGFDLTGCTPEEIQYTISHETPVVAMLSADHAVLVSAIPVKNMLILIRLTENVIRLRRRRWRKW